MSSDKPLSWMKHFEELRRVLIISVIALVVASFACFFYSDFFMSLLRRPIDSMGLQLVFIGVTEGFFIKFKVALYAGFLLSFPIIAWQVWRFVAPALYPSEKNYVLILVPVTVLLFAAGVIFAYFTVFPVMMKFLLTVSGDLEPMITVSQYLSFCISFLVPFGLVFELPVVSMFLTRVGVITPQWLSSKRKYTLLICFLLAAVLTPSPDPITQTMMALPMYVLYEVSIIVSRFTRAKKEARQKEEEEAWENEGENNDSEGSNDNPEGQ